MSDSPQEPRRTGAALWLLVKAAFQAAPFLTITSFMVAPFSEVTGIVTGLWLKFLADAVLMRDFSGARLAAILTAVTAASTVLMVNGVGQMRLTLQEKVSFALDRRLNMLTASLPGMEHHERPDYLDRMALLRSQAGSLSSLAGQILYGIVRVGQVAIPATLLAAIHPALLLVALSGLPDLLFAAPMQRMYRKMEMETAEPTRLAALLANLSMSVDAAKEFRVFNSRDEIRKRHYEAWRMMFDPMMATLRKVLLMALVGQVMSALIIAGAVAFTAYLAVDGRATVGDVLLTVVVAGQLSTFVAVFISHFQSVMHGMRTAERYLWLLDYAESARSSGSNEAPARIERGIKFENVSFKYPGSEDFVLEEVNFAIPAGSVVALVGENGAGKTTLVKLLCRFYEPAIGRITLDGIDLASLDPESWRSKTSAGFQDFMEFEFLARETIGVGDLPEIEAPASVAEALERAGASDLPGQWPHGLESQLGRQWDAGIELSVGQWQKLALARSLMRKTPLMLVLDEPTSALDAETEHALFERFAAAARARSETGSITVLVSHRFSTVRMADLIVVVEGGRIVDLGSHQELMQRGGLYAELFSLQAKSYK